QVRASTTSRSARGWRSAAPCRPCWRIRRPPAGVLSNPPTGEMPLDRAFDRFYTCDVSMHTWDLARATGQDDRFDPDTCADLLAGREQIEQVMRSSGQYGPRVPAPADADAQTTLLGFIGRDPNWT